MAENLPLMPNLEAMATEGEQIQALVGMIGSMRQTIEGLQQNQNQNQDQARNQNFEEHLVSRSYAQKLDTPTFKPAIISSRQQTHIPHSSFMKPRDKITN